MVNSPAKPSTKSLSTWRHFDYGKKGGGNTKVYYIDCVFKSVLGFIPLIPHFYIGSNLEIDAGGVLRPILNRERAQGDYHPFPACVLPHFERVLINAVVERIV